MEIKEGIYFLHSSFIIGYIEAELAKQNVKITELFRELVFSKTVTASCKLITTDLITCDKTIKEIKETHGDIIKSSGAYFDLIEEKSINEEVADRDLYSIKVLNNNRVSTVGAYFICADNKKKEISDLASSNGFTFKILSPSDY